MWAGQLDQQGGQLEPQSQIEQMPRGCGGCVPQQQGGFPCQQPCQQQFQQCQQPCQQPCQTCGKGPGCNQQFNNYCNPSMYDGKGARWDEPRYSGWTQSQWSNWVRTDQGMNWCNNKRHEADVIVDWMIQNWGADLLRSGSGVIDVGGDPGFVAAALLQRGIPATVIDPTWRLTGKDNAQAMVEQLQQLPGCPKFSAFRECFDDNFCMRNRWLVKMCSAIVSLYGDEATEPSLQIACATGKPTLVIPCNECMRFFPRHKPNYDGYVEACIQHSNQRGGRFELTMLHGAPFSRMGVIQWPAPQWAAAALIQGERGVPPALSVPADVLREMGVLHQVIWKMELAHRLSEAPAQGGCYAEETGAVAVQGGPEAVYNPGVAACEACAPGAGPAAGCTCYACGSGVHPDYDAQAA